MKELMLGLMAWASVQTGLPPTEAPRVEFLERCAIYWMVHPGTDCPAPGEGTLVPVAAYTQGTVYLRDTWSADNLTDVSTLLHELVHHMQTATGMRMTVSEGEPCPARAVEAPAYEAEYAWLESAGVDDVLETMRLSKISWHFLTKACAPMR